MTQQDGVNKREDKEKGRNILPGPHHTSGAEGPLFLLFLKETIWGQDVWTMLILQMRLVQN